MSAISKGLTCEYHGRLIPNIKWVFVCVCVCVTVCINKSILSLGVFYFQVLVYYKDTE